MSDPFKRSVMTMKLARYIADYIRYELGESISWDLESIDEMLVEHAISAFKSTNEYSEIIL